jgi:toxin ParE1/3/4
LKRRLRIDDAAARDYDEYAVYLSIASLEVAERFLDQLEETFEFLREYPGVGWPFRTRKRDLKDVRVWPVRGFKRVLIYYRITPTYVIITRVWHGSRDTRRGL